MMWIAMKPILIFNGSPRKQGNTAVLSKKLAEIIKQYGGKPEIIEIATLNISPCHACEACMRNKDGMCVQQDDMRPIYGKILDARGLVFAAPIYWFNYSAQLKLIIDRMYALFGMKGNALKGKAMAAILVYGGSDEHNSGAINAINSLKTMFTYLGGIFNEIVHGTAMDIGDVEKDGVLIQQVQNLGKLLMLNV